MHYCMAQTTSVMTVPFLPIPFPIMDSVECKILEQKTAKFLGEHHLVFIPAIIVYSTEEPF